MSGKTKTPAEVAAEEIKSLLRRPSIHEEMQYQTHRNLAPSTEEIAVVIVEAYAEREARIAEQAKEIETLRAAIGTPEVYAGVITRVVEDERDALVRRIAELEEAVRSAEKVIYECHDIMMLWQIERIGSIGEVLQEIGAILPTREAVEAGEGDQGMNDETPAEVAAKKIDSYAAELGNDSMQGIETPTERRQAIFASIITAAYAEREARIAALEAVVEKVARTRDGIPLVRGQEYWIMIDGRWKRSWVSSTWLDRFGHEQCYSTREAAEKAKETKG